MSIQVAAQNRDYGVILGVSGWDYTKGDYTKEISLLDFMMAKWVDGVIIKSSGTEKTIEKIYQLTQEENMRIVSILDKIDGPNIYSILVDNVKGGYLATKHLLELGHTNIRYVTYEAARLPSYYISHFSRERYLGMLKAYQEFGVKIPESTISYIKREHIDSNSEYLFSELLDSKNKHNFTAIFAYDDIIAASAARTFKQRGFSVPNDFSIVAL